MKKWTAVIILGIAQFVMVLDSTVMNVSISTVVKDLDTSVSAMQSAITFYTLTMAAVMLLGAKLGDVWGRRRAFVIGTLIYALGSLITSLSPNIVVLFLGWSVIEGLGAVLVIPAIAALVASNYEGKDRVSAFAMIGAISGAAVAAGPLIGGFLTTYLSWRYVFSGETVIMLLLLFVVRRVADTSVPQKVRIDVSSVLLSAAGLVLVVFGMLQSKTWGWVRPLHSPQIGNTPIAPLGISLTAYCIIVGAVLLWFFFLRQEHLVARGRAPLVQVSMFRIRSLRSGLSVLGAQYAITGGLFFMIPIYLQMTLGLDALQTGIRIFPLSISLILFSIVGTRLSGLWSPRAIVILGQFVLIASSFLLLSSVSSELKGWAFGIGLFFAGAALGLLASQLGNVNMSSVTAEQTSEVGGLQGVFQNLGSSLGTALIGSVLIATLSASFVGSVNSSSLPNNVKGMVAEQSSVGIGIVPVNQVTAIAEKAGLSSSEGSALTQLYTESQVSSLRLSFFALIVVAIASLLFARGIPAARPERKPRSVRRVGEKTG
ncbi:MFS transporter [Glaciibacter psychrotolerans]|uniref:MFS family permease n=1 Tax=Glaciibacter psychrotolerans TaxID=670054 RepID=A0A7Z0EB53_9MICO|nr:MFS family permease [Leifsonia psychrotolerans]